MNNAQYKALTAADCASKLRSFANEGKKILIIAHRNPDGDAVGSAFALKMIYEALGGGADCACSNKVPEYLSFLGFGKNEMINEVNKEYDAYITVDTASPSQFGDLEYLCEKTDFAIDHHASCTEYSDSYREGTASAAGELIFEIYEYLKESEAIPEIPDVARLIYAAITADSGSFKYSNTTENTHLIAAKLIKIINSDKNGINTAEIARLIHDSKSLNDLKAKKLCIENLRLTNDKKIAYVCIENVEMEKEGLSEEDFGSSVDVPRSIEGVLCAFVLKEGKSTEKEKLYRISARSNCSVDVAAICKKFGGGGHAKAAGGSITAENAEKAVNAVLAEFEKAVNS
ncbi:MAG: hypothetical protein E7647_05030 [Ruminococcaceae bacterium]|nr:hypothetical protein [Oscillospiraceae bacterium]